MAHILNETDGIKKAIVIAPSGNIYQVYKTPVEDGNLYVSAGLSGSEPIESVILGEHQDAQADELFDKFCVIFGGGKANIDLANYERTEPVAEGEESQEPEAEAPPSGGDDAEE